MEVGNDLAELPKGWVWTSLGEIIEPSKVRLNPREIRKMPYIGLEHIEKDTGTLLGFGYSEEVRSAKAAFHRGDLLYGKLRPYLNKVLIAGFDGICSTDILVFPRNSYVSNEFLLYRFLFGDFVRYASQNVSGVQHPRVNFNTLSEFVVALPPLAEQDRIVAKIEELFTQLDAGVAALEKAKAQLQRYRQAVLKAATEGQLTRDWREAHKGELEPASVLLHRILEERRAKCEAEHPGKRYKLPAPSDTADLPELPEGWVWTNMAAIGDITGGLTKNPKRKRYAQRVPYLRVANVYAGELRLDDVKTIGVKEIELERVLLEKGDMLVVEGNGSLNQIGRVALWDSSISPCVHQNHIIKVRFCPVGIGRLVLQWLLSDRGRRHITRVASSTSGLYTLSLSKVAALAVPLPSLMEQEMIIEQIERRLSVADQMEKAVEHNLRRARGLRHSILKRAFEGKLAPQDPTDEPASMLLQRIKAQKAGPNAKKDTRKKKRNKETKQQLELL